MLFWKPPARQMSVVLGVPRGPDGHFANDHSDGSTSMPAGMLGLLGRGESLGRARSSAWAMTLSVDTEAQLLKAGPPESGSVNGVPPAKLRSENSVKMRSEMGAPFRIAIGKFTVRRLLPVAMSAPQPTQAM